MRILLDTIYLLRKGWKPVSTEYGRRWKKTTGTATNTLLRENALRKAAQDKTTLRGQVMWKLRFSYLHNRTLKAGYSLAWEEAGAMVEGFYDDIKAGAYTPTEAVEDTVDSWRQNC